MRPFAIILTLEPAPPYLLKAQTALLNFEDKHFTSGTSKEHLYKVAVDTRGGPILAAIGFPEQYLAEFAESLRGHDLAIVQCPPTMFGQAPDGFSKLGIEKGDRIYEFEPLRKAP